MTTSVLGTVLSTLHPLLYSSQLLCEVGVIIPISTDEETEDQVEQVTCPRT